MGRVKEELLYAEQDAELAAWEAGPEGRAARERRAREHEAVEAERARREAVWAARHRGEWDEWVRLQPLLNVPIDLASDHPFDFNDFLREVGRRPSPRHAIGRRDDTLPYAPGNLLWAKGSGGRADPRPVDSPYLTVREAAAYCRREPKTILNHRSLGNIRSMPQTRPPLFRREDLDEWLTSRRKRRK